MGGYSIGSLALEKSRRSINADAIILDTPTTRFLAVTGDFLMSMLITDHSRPAAFAACTIEGV